MKFILLSFILGCSANKAKMTGTIVNDQMYFDRMVPVEIENAPDSRMWIKLSKKQMRYAKPGDKVIFYVKTAEVRYETK